jgi:hypothetical protein
VDDTSPDRHELAAKVDVAPLKASQLTGSKAGRNGTKENGIVVAVIVRTQNRLKKQGHLRGGKWIDFFLQFASL